MIPCILAFLALPGISDALPPAAKADPAAVDRANQMLREVPMRFEPNNGRLHRDVRFRARFADQQVLLTGKEAVVVLPEKPLRLRPVGGKVSSSIRGIEPKRARSSYFLGHDSSSWKQGVEQFGAVEYRGVYRGVDLIYHGKGKRLEYDFVVAPGVDPAGIAMEFGGADGLHLDANGELVVQVGDSKLRQPQPVAYTEMANGWRVPVEAGYRLVGRNRVAFELGEYDRSQKLVIDPVLLQATYFGGTSYDLAKAVAVTKDGKVWIAGTTTSTDLPVAGSYKDTPYTGTDIFVAQFDSSLGTDQLIYSTYLGGSFDDDVTTIALDSSGSAFIGGLTGSPDYPIRNGYQDTFKVGETTRPEAIVSQINLVESGDATLWYSTYLGGTETDVTTGIEVDSEGRLYVTGYTNSQEDFPITDSALQHVNRGGYDMWFAWLDPRLLNKGTGLYATYFGGSGTDIGTGVARGIDGKVYLTGYTTSEDFPISGASPYQAYYAGQGDAFLARIDPNVSGLDGLEYCTYLGGSDYEQTTGMANDHAGRLYISGVTFSTNFPTVNPYQVQNRGNGDAFLVRWDYTKPQGQEVTYSTYVGGSDSDVPMGVAVNAYGQVLLGGYTYSSDYPTRGSDVHSSSLGSYDAFVTWLEPNNLGMETLACSTYFGGESGDVAYGVAVDGSGNTYIAGSTLSRTGLSTGPSYESNYKSATDGFAAKFGPCGTLTTPSSQQGDPAKAPSRTIREEHGLRTRGALVLPDAIVRRSRNADL